MSFLNFNKYNNFNDEDNFRSSFIFVVFVLLSITGLIFFIIDTNILNPLLIIFLSAFIIYPYKKTTKILNSYFILLIVMLTIWLINNLGSTIVPFVIAIIISYLLDPIVSKLEKKGIKRWITSISIITIFIAVVTIIAIFLFPKLIEQASNITKQINIYVKDIKQFSTDKDTFVKLKQFGLNQYTLKEALDNQFMPIIQDFSKNLFDSIFKLLLSISNIATQLINIILLPILTFYFLKDLSLIKNKFRYIIESQNETLYKYLNKFNGLIRIYISWQITAAAIVSITAATILSIFNVPYAILIACIAGLLNPIPFFGTIISLSIGTIIAILVSDGNLIYNISIIIATLLTIHFINAYLLEPNIIGNKIGLHPIIMILSVFVFNSVFGIIGMLIAVPVTAAIVAFIKDMYSFYQSNKSNKYIY